jgi:hypothetical protein
MKSGRPPDVLLGMDGDIDDLREQYRQAPPGGPTAARAALALGLRLAARYLGEGAAEGDRDEAVDLLDEALTVSHDDVTRTHVVLGTLLFFRAVPIRPDASGDPSGEQAMAIVMALLGGQMAEAGRRADQDRARSHMRWVTEHEPPDAPARQAAEAMIAGIDLFSGSFSPSTLGSLTTLGPLPAALLELGKATEADAPAAELSSAMSAVLAQLPARHRLRAVILAEGGTLLARRSPAGLPEALTGLMPALIDTLDDDSVRGETVRALTGLLVSASAQTGDPAGVDRAVELADQLATESGAGRDQFLRALALTLRGRTSGSMDDLRAAVAALVSALETLAPDDELRPTATAMLGTLLSDRHLLQGLRADADAGIALLGEAQAVLDPAVVDSTVVRLAGLMSRTVLAVRHGDREELNQVIDELEHSIDRDYPWRSRLEAGLGLAYLVRGGPNDLRRGIDRLRRADAELAVEVSGRAALRAAGALAELLDGQPGDPAAGDRALARVDEAVADPRAPEPDRAALVLVGATVALLRDDEHLPDAIARFERARSGPITARPGHPLAASLHGGLARALRRAGRPAEAVSSGLDALRAHGDDVLLQTGTRHALDAARHASGLAQELVAWALEDGQEEQALTAMELGRGIVLHSAMIGSTVPGLLHAAGRDDLAADWAAEPPPYGAANVEQMVGTLVAVPSDLRPRALAALHDAGFESLSAAPSREEIAEAVRAAGADALVYLLDGHLLAVSTSGAVTVRVADRLRLDAPELTAYRAAHDALLTEAGEPHWRQRLNAVCDWAWPAFVEPLREIVGGPGRVVLVPVGELGAVPWHAARSRGRHAMSEFAFSYAASARQLRAVSRRRPATGAAVLVADPIRDLTGARAEVDWLKAHTYRDGVVLPAATGDEIVRAVTGDPAPAVLHLACHAVTGASPDRSHLVVAGPSELPVAEILAAARRRPTDAAGGLVVLSACVTDLTVADYDQALTLASAFLAAGPVGVIASRWPVDDEATACLMAMVHHLRTARGLPDHEALREAQAWMLDPGRKPPDALAGLYPARPGVLAEPAVWAAFSHHGI